MTSELKFWPMIPNKTTDLRYQVDTQSLIDYLRSELDILYEKASEAMKTMEECKDQCKFELAKMDLIQCQAVEKVYSDLMYKLKFGAES